MRPFKVRIGDDPEDEELENPKGYTGWAVINVPDESERLTRSMELATVGAQLSSGEMNEANVEATKKILAVAKNSVKDIAIVFGDSEPVTDVVDLSYYAEWNEIAMQIVGVVTNGPKSTAILRP